MGLDISAYSKIKLERVATEDEWEETHGDDRFWVSPIYAERPPFPDQLGGASLAPGGVYSFARAYDFRAGSYGGYCHWRDTLSRVVLRVPADEVWRQWRHFMGAPFYHLVRFSDCEGIIAGTAAEKLALDFANFQERVDEVPDGHWRKKYTCWRHAFEMAADGGLVRFH